MNITRYLLLYTLLPALIVVASLYAWGGLCYAFFRFSQPETSERLCAFLDGIRRQLARPLFPPRGGPATRAKVSHVGVLGWNFAPLAYVGLNASHLGTTGVFGVWGVFLDVGILFFGGMMFARGWYARRCMRLLNLETLEAHPA